MEMDTDLALMILSFFRVIIFIVFLLSSLGKIQSFSAFQESIEDMQILPSRATILAAFLVIGSELMIVILMLTPRPIVLFGFLLAGVLLTVFIFVLISVLRRNLPVSCNCFGANNEKVSKADIFRNVIFLTCAIVGGSLVAFFPVAQNMEFAIRALLITSFPAAIFTLICLNLKTFSFIIVNTT
ncbi:MAG: hypothetical protein DWQ07_07635 [Chloroflexi bacterium]|nr:MAG: hypothetical protein DWQ07_07635 [Chloroflexota bacterium]MBL1195426.1 hypothetical protein [Chloroflexota bacterium]NOH12709.1 hypothetical protein [Chloroflexota bacterium]